MCLLEQRTRERVIAVQVMDEAQRLGDARIVGPGVVGVAGKRERFVQASPRNG